MNKGRIIIISGPSGSGKTTLYQKLLTSRKDLVKSVSMTTRPKRPGEVHGRDYFFVSPKMFEYKIRAGHFLEYERFFNNCYGTPAKYVRDLLRAGKHVLLCIDVKGARTVLKKHPDALTIFVKTPTIADLKKRLMKRGSEDPKTIDQRLKRVKLELAKAKSYDYVLVNGDVNRAQRTLNTIITNELGSR